MQIIKYSAILCLFVHFNFIAKNIHMKKQRLKIYHSIEKIDMWMRFIAFRCFCIIFFSFFFCAYKFFFIFVFVFSYWINFNLFLHKEECVCIVHTHIPSVRVIRWVHSSSFRFSSIFILHTDVRSRPHTRYERYAKTLSIVSILVDSKIVYGMWWCSPSGCIQRRDKNAKKSTTQQCMHV